MLPASASPRWRWSEADQENVILSEAKEAMPAFSPSLHSG